MLVRRRLARALWAAGLVGATLPSCGRLGFELRAEGEGAGGDDPSGGGAAGAVSLDAGTGGAGSGGLRPSSGGATGGAALGGAGADALDASAGGFGASSDASASGGNSTGGSSSGGSSTGGSSSGGSVAAGGEGGASPSDAGAGGRVDGGTTPVPCASTASSPIRTWSFDSTVDGWVFTPSVGAASLTWVGATGNPTAGALALDATSGDGLLGWVIMYQTSADLRGQVAAAWVYQDSGAAVGLKLFAQSNTPTYDWADGGFVSLAPRTWTCLSLDFDAPDYASAGFDAADVVRYGLEVGGTAPVRLYVDQLVY